MLDLLQDEYRVGKHVIRVGDCIEKFREIETGSIDVVVTSPPYNIGIRYRSYGDRMADDCYLEWVSQWANEIKRVLANKGSVFLNCDGSAIRPWQAYDVANVFRQKFVLQNEFAWIKSVHIDGRTHGHFKPINSPRFVNRSFEKIFHFTLRGDVRIDRLAAGVPYQDKSNISRWNSVDRDLRCGGNVWFVPYPTITKRAQKEDHPAVFPVELARRCLLLTGAQGIVLDPFAGSGSVLVAAREVGMTAIGFEMDHQYAFAAQRRLRKCR